MKCAWDKLLALLPPWMQLPVDEQGKDTLQELRLRLNRPPELICQGGNRTLGRKVLPEDLKYVVNAASRYSPWTAASAAKGYITAAGGHRIGLCGEAVIHNGAMTGIRIPTSLCIRVARDFPGIAREAAIIKGSILILGKPGSGKTTLLRDLIRQRSEMGENVSVVDERGELFPEDFFQPGKRTDVITGCSKAQGIDSVLRTMGPDCVAVDEITAKEDCEALLQAGWCGVKLLATAHAAGRKDLLSRPVYRPLAQSKIFETVLVLQQDKSWKAERIAYEY